VAPRSLKEVLAGLIGVLVGTVAVHFGRDLPWRLAGLVGLAIGVLVITVLQSSARVRAVWRDGARHDD